MMSSLFLNSEKSELAHSTNTVFRNSHSVTSLLALAICQRIVNDAFCRAVVSFNHTAENALLGLKPIEQCLEFFSPKLSARWINYFKFRRNCS